MLSGIGDPDELRAHGIAVKVPLRGVGKNLQDHISASIAYRRRQPGPFHRHMRIDRIVRALADAHWRGEGIAATLPAGPMAALCTALDGVCTIWTPDGGERLLPVIDFIVGPNQTDLRPGELLRAIDLPAASLVRRTAFRQMSLTTFGRSAALLVGTLTPAGDFALTVTAATRRPVRLDFPDPPDEAALNQALNETIPEGLYFDDIHGDPAWRRVMTARLAQEIRQELLGP